MAQGEGTARANALRPASMAAVGRRERWRLPGWLPRRCSGQLSQRRPGAVSAALRSGAREGVRGHGWGWLPLSRPGFRLFPFFGPQCRNSPRLTLCLWEMLVVCGLPQPRSRHPLHGWADIWLSSCQEHSWLQLGSGNGRHRVPQAALRWAQGSVLGPPWAKERDCFATRGSDTRAVRLLVLGGAAGGPSPAQGGRRPEPTSEKCPVPLVLEGGRPRTQAELWPPVPGAPVGSGNMSTWVFGAGAGTTSSTTRWGDTRMPSWPASSRPAAWTYVPITAPPLGTQGPWGPGRLRLHRPTFSSPQPGWVWARVGEPTGLHRLPLQLYTLSQDGALCVWQCDTLPEDWAEGPTGWKADLLQEREEEEEEEEGAERETHCPQERPRHPGRRGAAGGK